jgi:hypothetical protein
MAQKNATTAQNGRIEKNLTGDIKLWELETLPAEIVSTLSIKITTKVMQRNDT